MSILPSKPGAKKRPGDKRSARERAVAMCALIAGGMSLRKAADAEALDHAHFLALARADTAMETAYREALEARAESNISQLSQLADEVMADAKKRGSRANAHVTAFGHKVKVEMWAAEKQSPKRYGQKVEATVRVGLASLIEESLKSSE